MLADQCLLKRIALYSQLTRQNKPIGTLLLLGSTSWGLIVAGNGQHDSLIISVFIICTWLMRSAGCIINDLADRKLDKHVERTQDRPLTTGKISVTESLALGALISLLALASSLFFLPFEVFYGALVCFALIVIYPFMKRYVWFPQLFLAVTFSSPIPMAFLAYHASIPASAWMLFGLSSLWIFCYDTIYAMADQQDDAKVGIKSTPLWLGQNTLIVVALLQGLFLLGWIIIGWFYQAHWLFWMSLISCAVLFIYQYQLCDQAIQSKQPNTFIRAFKNNHWIGWIIAVGLISLEAF